MIFLEQTAATSTDADACENFDFFVFFHPHFCVMTSLLIEFYLSLGLSHFLLQIFGVSVLWSLTHTQKHHKHMCKIRFEEDSRRITHI